MNNTNNSSGPAHDELLAEQTRRLFAAFPVMYLLEPACALLVVWLYWNSGIARIELLACGGLIAAAAFVRWVARLLFKHLSSESAHLDNWRWGATLLVWASAALMGLVVVYLNPAPAIVSPNLMPHQALFGGVLLSLTIIAITCYAIYLPAIIGYIVALTTPVALHVLFNGGTDGPIFSAVFSSVSLFILLASISVHRSGMQTLALQHKNLSLIDYLGRARSDAEALNEKLTREIFERKQAKQHLQEANDRLETIVQERTRLLESTNTELSAASQRLQLALDASNIGLWDWNVQNGETYHSNFDRLLGYGRDRFSNFVIDMQQMVHGDDWPKIKRAMVAHFKGRTSRYHAVYRIRHANGDWRWIEAEGRVVEWTNDNRAARMIGTRRDITDDKLSEDQLRLSATVFENASEGILIMDPDFHFLTVNDCFTRITGFSDEEVRGRRIGDTSHSGESNAALYKEIAETVRREGFWEGEMNERRKNGEPYPIWLQLSAVYDDDGGITHYVGMFSDLTSRKEAEEKLQFLSNYDRLTGLANRAQFREKLHKALALARLNRERVALVCLDLDRFRPINDSLGHEIGDKLLFQAAERLRALDVDESMLARVGGDEFTLIIDNFKHAADVEALAEDIIQALKKPFNINGHELLLGVSIGVRVFPENGKEAQALINQGDLAVHQAKRMGGNNVQFFRNDMRAASVEQLALETSLRKAIFKNEFVVHYQAKVDLSGNRISGCEALVRWQHPTMGLLPPKDFIPLAEESGLISAISEWVLERSCRQAAQWAKQGNPVCVSVNLSAQQFRKGDIVTIVDRVLELTELAPELLELELTESLIMEDLDKNIEVLRQLRERGVSLSLDDFGTGYSSLSYLKRFPVDTLKIDKSFVEDLHNSSDDAAITQAIIDMAHSLKMKVVAEGVEEDAQMSLLRRMGCDAIQGYLISRPVPEPDFLKLLKSSRQATG